jgi:hypothetical protein
MVTQTFERFAAEVVDVWIGGTTITATTEHPFWVVGVGWTAAGELRRGNTLLTKDGLVVHVDSIARREGKFKVYNFEVANAHTYYVAPVGVLVHNQCSLPDDALVVRGGQSLPENFLKRAERIDESGRLYGVSVNSAPGKTAAELSQGIPNGQVGVTTVGHVRAAGGDVVPTPRFLGCVHCDLNGLTPGQASDLFTPTIRNPTRP